jgi:hypothetical protein
VSFVVKGFAFPITIPAMTAMTAIPGTREAADH